MEKLNEGRAYKRKFTVFILLSYHHQHHHHHHHHHGDIQNQNFFLMFGSKHSFFTIRYFKTRDGLYGLSCYERIAVDNVAERGARMKSVGILCAKYTSLHEHMSFLEEEVR